MKTGKVMTAAALLAATTSLANVSNAMAKNEPVPAENQALKATDAGKIDAETFVRKASIGNIFEIESSKIAVEKSAHPEVKEFAGQMIKDHEKSSADLRATVPAAGIKEEAFEKALDPKHQKLLESIKNASEADFDRQYLKAQADAHKNAIALFTDYAANGENAKLREFATRTLPTLKHHNEEVMEVKGEGKPGGQQAH